MKPGTALRHLLIVIALAAAGIVLPAVPAHASVWQLTDHFDGAADTRWTTKSTRRSFAAVHTSAQGYADPDAYMTSRDPNHWVEVGRDVRISPVQLHNPTCVAQISLKSSPDAGEYAATNIEVIDPRTWTYVAVRRVDAHGDWTAYTVGPWVGGPLDVRFRVSLLATDAERWLVVDDLIVSCQYF